MNIFSTHLDPRRCSYEIDDKRLNKMIVESCQLLSTYCHLNNIAVDGLYKPCYQHHPCQKWLNEDIFNVYWLINLLFCYIDEYDDRFHKYHKCYAVYRLLIDILMKHKNFKDFYKVNNKRIINRAMSNITFPECFGIWKDKIDMCLDHFGRMQQLMSLKWLHDKRPPIWTKRSIPMYADMALSTTYKYV